MQTLLKNKFVIKSLLQPLTVSLAFSESSSTLLLPLLLLLSYCPWCGLFLVVFLLLIQSINGPNHFINGNLQTFREAHSSIAMPGCQKIVLEQKSLAKQTTADGQPVFLFLLVVTGPNSHSVVVVALLLWWACFVWCALVVVRRSCRFHGGLGQRWKRGGCSQLREIFQFKASVAVERQRPIQTLGQDPVVMRIL